MNYSYSRVHKYLDSDTIFVVYTLYSSPLDLEWNSDYEVKVQTFNINLRVERWTV